ncbi:MAG: hypothetical protein ACYTEQ_21235 [Planctomycetota bacterium]|jgi:hypothetical protein
MGWLLWPFRAVWRLAAFVLRVMGRLALGVLGLVLMGVGVALALTVAGAVVGVPVAVLGLLLVIRSIFSSSRG